MKGEKNEENFDTKKKTPQLTQGGSNDGVLWTTPTGETDHSGTDNKRHTDGFKPLTNGNHQPTAEKAPQPTERPQ